MSKICVDINCPQEIHFILPTTNISTRLVKKKKNQCYRQDPDRIFLYFSASAPELEDFHNSLFSPVLDLMDQKYHISITYIN